MSQHTTVSPTEAADRIAIRELVEAYPHCADRRDAKGQMAKPDDRRPSLRGQLREAERCVAICRAPALRRLDRAARAVITVTANQKRLVVVGATGNGRWLRASLRARSPRHRGRDRYRPQADSNHAREAGRGAPSR